MDYKCEYCGKVCKSQRGLEIHQMSCKLKPKIEEEITNVNNEEITNVNNEEITNVNNEEITKEFLLQRARDILHDCEEETLEDEIRGFFKGLGGRTTANRYDIEKMFGMYRKLYPKSNIGLVWDCTSCVSHVYNRLKDKYEKIK